MFGAQAAADSTYGCRFSDAREFAADLTSAPDIAYYQSETGTDSTHMQPIVDANGGMMTADDVIHATYPWMLEKRSERKRSSDADMCLQQSGKLLQMTFSYLLKGLYLDSRCND